ncbi:hypothetical protein UlMin_031681 [Ulmus minor]
MKRFETVHATMDMIQVPHGHETWTNSTIPTNGFQIPNPNSNPFVSKPVSMETRVSFDRNELSDWVEQITKQLIDDLPETAPAEAFPTINSEQEKYLTSCDSRPRKMMRREDDHQNESDIMLSKLDEHGLTLITLLFECAVAISVDNLGDAHRMILELTQMASPYAASCAERVVAYFAKAMASRVINSWLGICSPLINYKNLHSAFQVFNSISPFIKFSHFTSNQAILEAFHRRDRVHIIDLDIMQGLQWPALFHILATRVEGPPSHIRMTGVGTSPEMLTDTGKQLSSFAKRLGISFEFQPIAKKFGEINVSMFQLRAGETLALSPRILTLVEQDISHGGSFLDRFVGSLHYYSTMFDSLGAFFPSEDPSRHKVEHCLLYREINNILAIGGPARSGEDKFGQWRSELAARSSCLAQVAMSANSMAQAQLILNMFPPGYGYTLVEGEGSLRLGWKGTSLYTASAWTTTCNNSNTYCSNVINVSRYN